MSPRGRAEPPAAGSIGELLRRLRQDAGITSGAQAASLIGVTQATISRWEGNRKVPSPSQAERYARALHAPAATQRQLVAMARDRHEQYRAAAPARVAVGRSADHEKRVRRNEAQATRIQVFHPLVVPGLLQTERYIRGIFVTGRRPAAAMEAQLKQRLARAAILDEPGREFTFLLTAGALGWCTGGPDVMVDQIEHVLELSQRDNIRVGVIEWGTPATAFPPCGFDIYDEATVVVGVFGGSAYHNTPADVSRLVTMFAELERMAVFDDKARAVLERVAGEYRALT